MKTLGFVMCHVSGHKCKYSVRRRAGFQSGDPLPAAEAIGDGVRKLARCMVTLVQYPRDFSHACVLNFGGQVHLTCVDLSNPVPHERSGVRAMQPDPGGVNFDFLITNISDRYAY